MEIQFWWYVVWHEMLCIFNIGSALIWLWLWVAFVSYELYFLWFILYMVNWIPLHDSYGEVQWSYKLLMTESVSFHKFMLVVLFILNFVFYFMLYRSLMVIWFPYIFDYIPAQFLSWFHWIIFLKKISLSLNPCSLGSTLGIIEPQRRTKKGLGRRLYCISIQGVRATHHIQHMTVFHNELLN